MEMLVRTMMHVCCFEDFKLIIGVWSGVRILEPLDHNLGTLKVRFVIFGL